MRRPPGTGTITPRKNGFMARLPDVERTSLGIFTTRDEAEGVLDAAVAELREGKVATGKSLAVYGRSVMNRRELDGYRGVDGDRSRWKYVEAWECGEYQLRSVQRGHVLAWIRKLRSKGLATSTVKNALNLLRTVFAQALHEGLVDANPCSDLKIRDHGRSDDTMHPLNIEELNGLVFSAPKDDAAIVAVAAGSGIRQGEQRSLRWEHVIDLEGEDPHLEIRFGSPKKPTKSGKVRRVDLFGVALEAMRYWRRRRPKATGLVWPTSEGHARWQGKIVDRDEWKSWLARAGIGRPVRWHDLRHTAATLLLSGAFGEKWTTEEVRELLGHSSVAVTERYAKPNGALAIAAARRHREGTKAPDVADRAMQIAAEILRSRLRDLNSRPTVYEGKFNSNNVAHLERARTFVVSLLQSAARNGDCSVHAVELAGRALDALDAIATPATVSA